MCSNISPTIVSVADGFGVGVGVTVAVGFGVGVGVMVAVDINISAAIGVLAGVSAAVFAAVIIAGCISSGDTSVCNGRNTGFVACPQPHAPRKTTALIINIYVIFFIFIFTTFYELPDSNSSLPLPAFPHSNRRHRTCRF